MGHPRFAPTWEMVMGYKNGRISQAEYTKLYVERLLKVDIEEYIRLLDMDLIVLCCFCRPG